MVRMDNNSQCCVHPADLHHDIQLHETQRGEMINDLPSKLKDRHIVGCCNKVSHLLLLQSQERAVRK